MLYVYGFFFRTSISEVLSQLASYTKVKTDSKSSYEYKTGEMLFNEKIRKNIRYSVYNLLL